MLHDWTGSGRVMARQAHALREQVKRLTVRRRSPRSERTTGKRGATARPIDLGPGQPVGLCRVEAVVAVPFDDYKV